MEKCKIKINNKILNFNYFYKFNKEEKYKIKYIFIANISNAYHMLSTSGSLIRFDL